MADSLPSILRRMADEFEACTFSSLYPGEFTRPNGVKVGEVIGSQSLGAFSGSEHAMLRDHIDRVKAVYPNSPDLMWDEAVTHFAPGCDWMDKEAFLAVAAAFRREADRIEGGTSEPLIASPPPTTQKADEPDGPVPPDGFRFRGKVCRGLAPTPYAALCTCWESRYRHADQEALVTPLVGDPEHPELLDLATPRRDLNTFFRKHGINYRARVKDRYLLIENSPPLAPTGKRLDKKPTSSGKKRTPSSRRG